MVEKISISLYPEDLSKLDFIEQTFCPKGINYSRSTRIKVAIQLAYERALTLQNAEKR